MEEIGQNIVYVNHINIWLLYQIVYNVKYVTYMQWVDDNYQINVSTLGSLFNRASSWPLSIN